MRVQVVLKWWNPIHWPQYMLALALLGVLWEVPDLAGQ